MEVSGVSRCEYYHRREELRREDWSSANLVCGRYCARPAALGKAAPTAKHPRGPCFTGNSETVLIAAWWSKKAANNHDDPPWLRVLCVVLRELLQLRCKKRDGGAPNESVVSTLHKRQQRKRGLLPSWRCVLDWVSLQHPALASVLTLGQCNSKNDRNLDARECWVLQKNATLILQSSDPIKF
jgi:hypothetical protein